jgi:hypothetical protein
VRLYKVRQGEQAVLYEKGLPVVDLECEWHVDVQQKVPLNTERNNVSHAYQKAIYVAVVNAMCEVIPEENAATNWVQTAISDNRISDEAVKTLATKQFGTKFCLASTTDSGSDKEAVSHEYKVIPRNALNKDQKRIFKRVGIGMASDQVENGKFKKDADLSGEVVPTEELESAEHEFEKFIMVVSPRLIEHEVTVQFIDDAGVPIEGCTQWRKNSYVFTVNLAHHDCNDWLANLELVLHELAHHKVQNNDHLKQLFYDTVTELGAKMTRLALEEPELFPAQYLKANLVAAA